ncbi:hypothetical protein C3B44_03785 [Corynebacterium yudongzhengii]|uniref:Uncharacterized protein n=1 Tax=Corynebacterium yudongzhengii TaxID=2080740 RepID=A0A2U1T6I0_9CORY|nr:hypothetical protein [Corynebacterium yudongzhengii]AWB81590.1 hypothetical protein C3B44_03785 [Corynebacterium yudongzhengii]PWC01575.1 hypothetical protein DF222_06445 [Corynebacterium yudongzhengii]
MSQPDYHSRRVGAVLVLVLLIFAGLFVYAMFDDATNKPQAIAGDQLGPDTDESFTAYQERAGAGLQQAAEEHDEPVFALVTFAEPLTAGKAGELLEGIDRVNTMLVGISTPRPLPEPISGKTRADVFAHQFSLIDSSLEGVGDVPRPYRLTAVTAYDTPQAFAELAGADSVAAVEVLPPDAAWGNFGIRPAVPPGIDMLEVAAPR